MGDAYSRSNTSSVALAVAGAHAPLTNPRSWANSGHRIRTRSFWLLLVLDQQARRAGRGDLARARDELPAGQVVHRSCACICRTVCPVAS